MTAKKVKGAITIFVPAYNEEKTIGTVVLLAKKYGTVFVVDDGSQDRTASIAAAAGAAVLRHGKNMGYGAAARTAFSAAKKSGSRAFVFLDADFQHEPREIPALVHPILSGKADVCLGSRFLGKFVGAPPYRREGVMLLNGLFATGAKNQVDSQCGFRAFSKKAMGRIKFTEQGYAACAEIIVSARQAGLKISEVPVDVRYYHEKSKNPAAQVAELLEYATRQVVRRNPLLFFGAAGGLSLLASALLGIFVVETFYAKNTLPTGSAFLTVFTGIAGVVLLSVAAILYAVKLAGEKKKGREIDGAG